MFVLSNATTLSAQSCGNFTFNNVTGCKSDCQPIVVPRTVQCQIIQSTCQGLVEGDWCEDLGEDVCEFHDIGGNWIPCGSGATPKPTYAGVCSSPSSHYTCSKGTAGLQVENASTWTWTCFGNGGGNQACSETKPFCAVGHYNCTPGTALPWADGATTWKWGCKSSGGTIVACSEIIPACAATHYNCLPDRGTAIPWADGVNTWRWVCRSAGGTDSAVCTETKPPTPINGVCKI